MQPFGFMATAKLDDVPIPSGAHKTGLEFPWADELEIITGGRDFDKHMDNMMYNFN